MFVNDIDVAGFVCLNPKNINEKFERVYVFVY